MNILKNTNQPLVIKKFETHFNQKSLNQYIEKLIHKDLYFIHE